MALSETRKLLREGVVIILSILLAFSIDAAWDARQDRLEERALLSALRGDFLASRAEALGTISVHERGGRLIAEAHALSVDDVTELSSEAVSETLLALATPRTFDPVRGTLDAMIGSGQLDLIRDAELRRALVVFLNLVGDSEEDARYMSEGSRRVWDLQIRHGGPWRRGLADMTREGCEAPVPPSSCLIDDSSFEYFPDPTPAALQAVLDDPELMGQVRQLQSNVVRYVAEVRRIGSQIDRILELLDRNLD